MCKHCDEREQRENERKKCEPCNRKKNCDLVEPAKCKPKCVPKCNPKCVPKCKSKCKSRCKCRDKRIKTYVGFSCLYDGLDDIERLALKFLERAPEVTEVADAVRFIKKAKKTSQICDKAVAIRTLVKYYIKIGDKLEDAIKEWGLADYPDLNLVAYEYDVFVQKCTCPPIHAEVDPPIGPRGQASIALQGSNAEVCNTINKNIWNISKSGSYDSESKIIKWTVSTTKAVDNTATPVLKVNGALKIYNSGSANADIGNIVINLQRRQGNNWVSLSADIADVTRGDLYGLTDPTAYICSGASSENKSSFTENQYSGPLNFMDGNTNTLFSLVPNFVIAPGAVVYLLYQAQFLNIPLVSGADIRIEAIVTFGNAGARGGSGAVCNGIKYKGDGVSANNVRSVPDRQTRKLPTPSICNESVTLTDISSNISAYPNVGFDNFVTDIGAGSGIELISGPVVRHVSIMPNASDYDVTYTNCASLHNPDETQTVTITDPLTSQSRNFVFICCAGVDEEECSSVTVPGNITPPPVPEYCTYTQGGWGAVPAGNNPASILVANFSTVYPTGVRIGTTPNFNALFTSATAIQKYLPTGSSPSFLNVNVINPSTTSSGIFGGQVLALQINVDFSDANVIGGAAKFGDAIYSSSVICNESGSVVEDLFYLPFVGKSVRQILAIANTLLGGSASPPFTVSDIPKVNRLIDCLNKSFDNCMASAFGLQALVCVPPAILSVSVDNANATAGDSVTFSVTATGTGPLSYQWSKDTIVIPGATSATYNIPSVALADAGNYSVTVSNACGSVVSNLVVLNVCDPPTITISLNKTDCVIAGDLLTVTTTVSGTPSPLVAYTLDDLPVTLDGNLLSTAGLSAGQHSLRGLVLNSCGTDSAFASFNVVDPIVITSLIPASPHNVIVGDSVTFSVTATGIGPLSYQWFKDNTVIPSATSATYNIPSAVIGDVGTYSVTVSNVCGSVVSNAIVLNVTCEPLVIQSVSASPSVLVALGDSVTISATVSGSAPFTYSWTTNNGTISNPSAQSTLATPTSRGDAIYTVTVTDACSNTATQTVTVQVVTQPPPPPPPV